MSGTRSLYLGKNYGTSSKFETISSIAKTTAMNPDAWGGAGLDRQCTVNVTTQKDVLLMRFDISSLPSNTVISDASVYLKCKYANANSMVLSIRQLKKNWGINDNTSVYNNNTENPAAHGQATYRRSFDYNGTGGDAYWTSGNDFTMGTDTSALCSATTYASQTADAWYSFGCTGAVVNWYDYGQPNYGFCLWKDTTGTQASAPYYWADRTAASSPYMIINYDIKNEVMNSGTSTL